MNDERGYNAAEQSASSVAYTACVMNDDRVISALEAVRLYREAAESKGE